MLGYGCPLKAFTFLGWFCQPPLNLIPAIGAAAITTAPGQRQPAVAAATSTQNPPLACAHFDTTGFREA